MPDACRRILVTGKVQGVFFRQMLRVTADRNGVRGWVRNTDDGRVEAVLEGGRDDVGRVIEWSRRGPANSRVTDVAVSDEPARGISGFEVRY